MVIVTGRITPPNGTAGFVSFSVDGSTPSDEDAFVTEVNNGNQNPLPTTQGSTVTYLTVTATSHTFTLQYRDSAANSVTYSDRTITVIPIG